MRLTLLLVCLLGCDDSADEAADGGGPVPVFDASTDGAPEDAAPKDAEAPKDAAPEDAVVDAAPPPDPPTIQTCTVGLDDRDIIDAIEMELAQLRSEPVNGGGNHKIGGVVVGLAAPGLGLRVQAFGTTAPEGDVALTEGAIFDIGSIQKHFRWTLLHLLAARGHVDIDAPVDQYLPEPLLGDKTIRDLMSHATRLKDWDEVGLPFYSVAFGDPEHEFSYAEMIGLLGGSPFIQPAAYPGGYRYTDYGPLVGGRAAEVAVFGVEGSEGQVQALTQDHIFTPLGLEDSSFQHPASTPAALTPGFWANGEPHTWATPPRSRAAISTAAGGLIFTNACDLLRYGDAFFEDPNFVSESALEDILDPSKRVRMGEYINGNHTEIGWSGAGTQSYDSLYTAGVEGLWGHTGSSQHGHASAMFHLRDLDATFVVLANVADNTVLEDPLTDPRVFRPGAEHKIHYRVIRRLKEWVEAQ